MRLRPVAVGFVGLGITKAGYTIDSNIEGFTHNGRSHDKVDFAPGMAIHIKMFVVANYCGGGLRHHFV